MEITTVEGFLNYYKKTRQITNNIIEVIPHHQVDWAYMPGKFTIGDLVRHIAAIERTVFAEVASGNQPAYKGCGKELADGYENILSYFNNMHEETLAILTKLTDTDLKRKIKTMIGTEIELGSFLRTLIIHEVHHRGALCIYLNLLGVETPPIIGLKEEDVKRLSAQ